MKPWELLDTTQSLTPAYSSSPHLSVKEGRQPSRTTSLQHPRYQGITAPNTKALPQSQAPLLRLEQAECMFRAANLDQNYWVASAAATSLEPLLTSTLGKSAFIPQTGPIWKLDSQQLT